MTYKKVLQGDSCHHHNCSLAGLKQSLTCPSFCCVHKENFPNFFKHTHVHMRTHTQRLYFWISLLPLLCIFSLIEAPTRRSVQLSRHLPATLQLTKHQEAHSAACDTAHLLIRTHIPTPVWTQDFCFPINYASGVATPVMCATPSKDLAEQVSLIWNGDIVLFMR